MSVRFVALLATAVVILQTVLSAPNVPKKKSEPSYENPVRGAVEDEIKDLPGSPPLGFRQYSGYLNSSGDPDTHLFTHYWFVEADKDQPDEAPLLIWLSGGPGGSSLHALFLENGPFDVAHDGKTLRRRQFSWNKLANVLYLESPVQVGYSYSHSNDSVHSDSATANEHYHALQSFFAKFPRYESSPMFLVGQGYGGDYVVDLAWQHLHSAELKNLRGIAYGDGYMQANYLATGAAFFAHENGLINATAWHELTNLCCTKGTKRPTHYDCAMKGPWVSAECERLMDKIMAGIVASGVNPHNIHDKCSLRRAGAGSSWASSHSGDIIMPPGCDTAGPLTEYLNDRKVRAALHIPARVGRWQIFKKLPYRYEGATETTGIYDWQLRDLASRMPVLVYNGELDLTCNAHGNQWFIDSLDLDEIADIEPWWANGHEAGMMTRYGKLTFVELKDAGKDVPREKPAEAYELMRDFIYSNLVKSKR